MYEEQMSILKQEMINLSVTVWKKIATNLFLRIPSEPNQESHGSKLLIEQAIWMTDYSNRMTFEQTNCTDIK